MRRYVQLSHPGSLPRSAVYFFNLPFLPGRATDTHGFMTGGYKLRTMTVPPIVQSTLDDEDVSTRVPLGGEDELFVTPSRTLIYRADGL